MKSTVLLDAGPLVALLAQNERHHEWARDTWQTVAPPLLTCESALSEACFLLSRAGLPCEPVFEFLRRGAVEIAFSLSVELDAVSELMRRYSDVPMSLADACLVRMAETHPRAAVMTLDSDFRTYRKNRRQTIPTLMPPR